MSIFGIKGMIGLALVAIIAVAVAVCFRACKPPNPPRVVTRDYTVVAVPNGASITVTAGIVGRKTATVSLQWVAAAEGAYAEPSRANLDRLAGKTVRVEGERGRLLGEALGQDSDEQPEEYSGTLEAHGVTLGIVYGEAGACLNLSQVADGLATCQPGAPKDYIAAQTAAKKAKLGMWVK